MTAYRRLFIPMLIVMLLTPHLIAQNVSCAENSEPSKLLVVWTSGDRDVALKMVFMYTKAAKQQGWWGDVHLLVWGPSSKLLSVDEELQKSIGEMKEAGVILTACKACADSYGVSEKLGELGLEVKYMGKPLTDMIKSGWATVTF